MAEAKWEASGKRLRELRENYRDDRGKKLSIYKVAKQLHISGNYLSELERGTKSPSDIVLENIAEFYGVEKSEIFALYGRLVPEDKGFLLANPSFRKTITTLSVDERLTEEEREHLSHELMKLYENLTAKKKGVNKEE